jgi:hypothetical protein
MVSRSRHTCTCTCQARTHGCMREHRAAPLACCQPRQAAGVEFGGPGKGSSSTTEAAPRAICQAWGLLVRGPAAVPVPGVLHVIAALAPRQFAAAAAGMPGRQTHDPLTRRVLPFRAVRVRAAASSSGVV